MTHDPRLPKTTVVAVLADHGVLPFVDERPSYGMTNLEWATLRAHVADYQPLAAIAANQGVASAYGTAMRAAYKYVRARQRADSARSRSRAKDPRGEKNSWGYDTKGYRTDVRRDPKKRTTWRWTLSTVDSPPEWGTGYPNEQAARAACAEAIAEWQRGELPKVEKTPQGLLYE